MKDYYKLVFVFWKVIYFIWKNDYFKIINESELMGFISGYRDEIFFYVYCLKNNYRKNFILLFFDVDSLRFYVCGELMF